MCLRSSSWAQSKWLERSRRGKDCRTTSAVRSRTCASKLSANLREKIGALEIGDVDAGGMKKKDMTVTALNRMTREDNYVRNRQPIGRSKSHGTACLARPVLWPRESFPGLLGSLATKQFSRTDVLELLPHGGPLPATTVGIDSHAPSSATMPAKTGVCSKTARNFVVAARASAVIRRSRSSMCFRSVMSRVSPSNRVGLRQNHKTCGPVPGSIVATVETSDIRNRTGHCWRWNRRSHCESGPGHSECRRS